jgi:D-3-phosphoglycerate dehydrogenase
VLAEAILLLRGIPEKNALVHRGGWSKSAEGSYETRGKTLGIVGYGSIGSQLSVLAESLGMYVIYYDAVTKLPLGNARQVVRWTNY